MTEGSAIEAWFPGFLPAYIFTMSCAYVCDPAIPLIKIQCSGQSTPEERQACVSRLLTDLSVPGDMRIPVLIDMTFEASPPSVPDAAGMVTLLQQLQRRFQARIALLSTAVGQVSMAHLIVFAGATEGVEVMTFSSMSVALQWLAEPAS